jgi:hypothetical protein
MILNIQLLANLVMYHADQFYQIKGAEFTVMPLSRSTKVLILARHLYLERNISLPIMLARDVKAALDLEMAELQAEFYVFYKITSVAEGHSHITIWQVPRQSIAKTVLVAIPETYLLGLNLDANDIISFSGMSATAHYLVAKTFQGMRSTSSHQVEQSVFSQAVGITDAVVQVKTAAELNAMFKAMLKRHWSSLLVDFWVKRPINTQKLNSVLKPFIKPALIACAAYLVVTSSFVYIQHQLVQSRVEQQGAEIKQVLNLQSQISQLQLQLEELDVSGDKHSSLWPLWQVLAPLYEQGVTFKFIRYNDGKIYISAESVSSSKTLEYLLDSPLVSAPEFTTAVRKMKQTETYIIRFSLTHSDNPALNTKDAK